MQLTTFNKFITILLIVLLSGSCVSRKKMVYFLGDEESKAMQVTNGIVYEVGDILSVDVTGTDPEVAKPFNQVELVRQGNQPPSYENGIPVSYGYLVYADSNIALPIIGEVAAAGYTREELTEKIETVLSGYIDKPQVSIRLMNFKVTVLGDVKNPGTFTVPNERITILEAIGIAKDLNPTGKRKNVLVVRIENGEKKEYRVDLTSKTIFDSPAYYLKQNDVVYVEPNMRTRYDGSILRTAGGAIISATSLIVSTIILIKK